MNVIDVFVSSVIKGIAGIAFLAGLSILPFYDDWKYDISDDCTIEMAKKCQNLFIDCYSSIISVDPMSGAPNFNPGSYVASSNCIKVSYDPICKKRCGYPKHTGSWWEKFQRYGPWYLKLIPGASSYWESFLYNKKSPS